MARQRKYHTPEEKDAANRAKSKRSYDKHKDKINSQRRKIYKRQSGRKSRNTKPPKTISPSTEEVTSLAQWMSRVKTVQLCLDSLTLKNLSNFVDGVYLQYLTRAEGNNTDCLEDNVGSLMDMQTELNKCQEGILQLVGIGAEWNKAELTIKDVRMLVSWIEEIMCIALVEEKAGVEDMYKKHRFMFQQM